MVLARLHFDKRQDGAQGLALTSGIVELGLLTGDRLEPSRLLPDVSLLAEIDLSHGRTITVIFWRRSNESLAKHRNPIFDSDLGITPKRSMTVDTLHCLYLGVFKTWCCVVIWNFVTRNCYARVGTADENLGSSIMVFHRLLMQWYEARAQSRPGENLTRLADLVPKMLGSTNERKIKVKAAECWGMLLFLISELHRLRGHAGPQWAELLEAGECLVQMVD